MKAKTILLMLIICLLVLTGCESTNTDVTIQYGISSKQYNCDSALTIAYPVKFRLPKDHGVVEITLNAANSYAFLGNMNDATIQFPFSDLPFGNIGTNVDYKKVFDFIQAGTDVIVAGAEVAEGVYNGNTWDSLAAMITGQKLATYTVRIVAKNGEVLYTFNIPIGRTVLELSENVDYIEIRSMIDVPDGQYKKDGTMPGKIAYENAHEINTVHNNVVDLTQIPETMETIAPIQDNSRVEIYGGLPTLPSSFIFASGAGGWSDELHLNSDGGFTGEYHDSEWGPDHPNGLEYFCNYNGRFGNIHQINDYSYSMELDELYMSRAAGEEWDENGVHYISTEPYGISGKAFTLYLPNATRSSYPACFEEWYWGVHGSAIGDTLSCFALVNESQGIVFWGD